MIISIALIGIGTVSAFSGADHIVEAPFATASVNDSFNVPLYVLFATISVDNSFIWSADVSDVPFNGYVNIPFADSVDGPFSLPIVGSGGLFNSSLNIPFAAISVGNPFSLPIVGLGNPLDIILSELNYFNPLDSFLSVV
ncbi:hypothetical protein [uncultured Methanobrevibacter sp.]|uniref:hypothetical protein n=1 Tax=uncultured Methanobrevibacter sp. TaxID=253161 RepID=UPI0025F894F9|nr:hypothetical protein [uncultured Methanobrevibacter sp.]